VPFSLPPSLPPSLSFSFFPSVSPFNEKIHPSQLLS